MEKREGNEMFHDCAIKLRVNPQRRKEKVYIGCGAGFGGDRPLAALKLLKRVEELNYLVLECLAERTLAERYQVMVSGGDGYDSRISEWMHLLLPVALEKGVCIITNMGAMDPPGAQEKVLEIASSLGLDISVVVAHEVFLRKSGPESAPCKPHIMEGGISTYLGAAPIVECLEKFQPDVVITSRIADAALFLAPMVWNENERSKVYELGWNWDDYEHLAQGTLAGHLLECGCQLTGGYFMHPGDKYRDMSFPSLLDLSLPYAEISFDGKVFVAKAEGSGGVLNLSTCAQQLLYEIGDPGAYVTPDVVIDLQDVRFDRLSNCKVLCAGAKPSVEPVPQRLLQLVPKDCGWKGWGEISYGGYKCVQRAKAAEFLVRSWVEEMVPGISSRVISYVIGLDSLKATSIGSNTLSESAWEDIRLRMDGLFELKEHAVQFAHQFTALYTNGPAAGGGISTGYKKEIVLEKQLVRRDSIFWQAGVKHTMMLKSNNQEVSHKTNTTKTSALSEVALPLISKAQVDPCPNFSSEAHLSPAPSDQKIPLYAVAHSRAGDKGNDLNFSVIPHFPPDIERLKLIITPKWVKGVVSSLVSISSFSNQDDVTTRDKWVNENLTVEIYEVRGIHSLNVVVRNILDGGVNCSRRIDRHGKTISDLILCQQVLLP